MTAHQRSAAPRVTSRTAARAAVALLCALSASLYALIGLGVINPAGEGDRLAMLVFGGFSCLAFGAGVPIVLAYDRPAALLAGAALQSFAIATYFSVAPSRTPNYETWGITLKVVQAITLAALVYLLVTARGRTVAERGGPG